MIVTTPISLDSTVPFSIEPTFISIVSSSSNETSLKAARIISFVVSPAGISIVAPNPTLSILLSYLLAMYKDPALTIAELFSPELNSPKVLET